MERAQVGYRIVERVAGPRNDALGEGVQSTGSPEGAGQGKSTKHEIPKHEGMTNAECRMTTNGLRLDQEEAGWRGGVERGL